MADTAFGAFTDAIPQDDDWLVAERGAGTGVGVNLHLYDLAYRDATGAVRLINGSYLPADGSYLGIGAYFASGAWRNTEGSQGGAVIRNNSGVLTLYAGSSPGAAGSAFSDMRPYWSFLANGHTTIGGGQPMAAGGTRLFDIWNDENTSGSSAVQFRLITRSADGASIATADLTKYRNGALYLMNNEAGAGGGTVIGTQGQARWGVIASGHLYPWADNTYQIGAAGNRATTIFALTGTINTSDEREKTWRGGLTDAQRRAARRIINELGWFQWTEEIDRKGEGAARLHFGVRAQAVIRILIEEGVEAQQDIGFPADRFIPENKRPSFRSAFLCFDTWEAQREWQDRTTISPSILGEDGKPFVVPAEPELVLVKASGNRFGLRTDQLLLFLLAATMGDRSRL